jgi:hypothetical protein
MPARLTPWQNLIAGLLLLVITATARAAESVPEFELKAAFLYNFALFTEWPEKPEGDLTLCLYGKDRFGAAMDNIEGKPVKNAAIRIRRPGSLSQLRGCHMLFIADSELHQLQEVLGAVKGAPVLTVTDSRGGGSAGVMINLTLVGQRVTFEINTVAARAAGLNISSKLLRLANVLY